MAYEFTKLSEVALVDEPSLDANVMIEEGGKIKKVPKSKIGAQSDWNETDETSPAFILNKPEISDSSKVTYLFAESAGYKYLETEYLSLFDMTKFVLNPELINETDPASLTPLTRKEVINAFNSGVVRLLLDNRFAEGKSLASSILYYTDDPDTNRVNLCFYQPSATNSWPHTPISMASYTFVQPPEVTE